jgi:hypothetical protein
MRPRLIIASSTGFSAVYLLRITPDATRSTDSRIRKELSRSLKIVSRCARCSHRLYGSLLKASDITICPFVLLLRGREKKPFSREMYVFITHPIKKERGLLHAHSQCKWKSQSRVGESDTKPSTFLILSLAMSPTAIQLCPCNLSFELSLFIVDWDSKSHLFLLTGRGCF